MPATKTLNLRVDSTLKSQAEAIFSELGLPTSTAITIFLKSVVRRGGIPFEMCLSHDNLETLQAIDDVNNHRNMSRKFSSVEELMEDLNA